SGIFPSQRQQPLLFSQISRHRAECPPGEIRDSTRLATVFSQFLADFTDSIAQLQCSVGLQLEEILDDFQDKCEQLGSRQGDQSCCGSALDAWFSLLKEMHEEA
uniref:NIBAN protein n=1 Tax=Macrostomum lignano TaxID=282301 RepID=A0A1I8IA91_9PLAT